MGLTQSQKDALRDEDCPWLIKCTTQEYLVNVGQDSHFNNIIMIFLSFISTFNKKLFESDYFKLNDLPCIP
jgi:hypothetical protein